MNTTIIERHRRRRYSAEFKAEAVTARRQPGVSMAAVAMSRTPNANLPRRRAVEAERGAEVLRGQAQPKAQPLPAIEAQRFIPVAIEKPAHADMEKYSAQEGAVLDASATSAEPGECKALDRRLAFMTQPSVLARAATRQPP